MRVRVRFRLRVGVGVGVRVEVSIQVRVRVRVSPRGVRLESVALHPQPRLQALRTGRRHYHVVVVFVPIEARDGACWYGRVEMESVRCRTVRRRYALSHIRGGRRRQAHAEHARRRAERYARPLE